MMKVVLYISLSLSLSLPLAPSFLTRNDILSPTHSPSSSPPFTCPAFLSSLIIILPSHPSSYFLLPYNYKRTPATCTPHISLTFRTITLSHDKERYFLLFFYYHTLPSQREIIVLLPTAKIYATKQTASDRFGPNFRRRMRIRRFYSSHQRREIRFHKIYRHQQITPFKTSLSVQMLPKFLSYLLKNVRLQR